MGGIEENLLDDLLHEEVIDEKTRSVLLTDSRVNFLVEDIHELYFEGIDAVREHKRSEKYFYGEKLLFLENLVEKNQDALDGVLTLLSDRRKKVLFTNVEQGVLYGEMLLAHVKEEYDGFIEKYNKETPSQKEYVYDKTIKLELDRKIEKDEEMKLLTLHSDFIEFEAVKENVHNHLKNIITERLNKVSENMEKDRPDDNGVNHEGYNAPSHIYLAFLDEEFDDFHKPFLTETGALLDQLFEELNEKDYYDFPTFYDIYPDANKEFLEEHVDEMIDRYLEDLYDKFVDPKEGEDLGFDYLKFPFTEEQKNELITLHDEIIKISLMKNVSDKIQVGEDIIYSFELSEKHLLDITYGNDSGCCISIDKDRVANGYGMPHMIADNATYFFNIYQKVGEKKKRRRGIVLAFEAYDEEGKKYLACNSTELFAYMTPLPLVKDIVDYVENGLADFAEKNDFNKVIMSTHGYNTSQNYSSRSENVVKVNLIKKSIPDEPEFYSEIVKNGIIKGEFYLIN
ncbi:hypothetical protein ACFL1H_04635 [Nanoarchaeota archaeon]